MRRSGAGLAGAVVLAGWLLPGLSPTASPVGAAAASQSDGAASAAAKAIDAKTATADKAFPSREEMAERAGRDYQEDLQAPVDAACGEGGAPLQPDTLFAQCVQPDNSIIALLPDPAHTHFGLLFDRAIEAIQEALQDSGYTFVKATLPWDPKAHPEPDDFEKRLKQQWYEEGKQDWPGWMTFRRTTPAPENASDPAPPKAGDPAPPKAGDSTPPNVGDTALPKGGDSVVPRSEYLHILIVGESPTAGINKKQFRHAVQLIRPAMTDANCTTCPKRPPLKVLGPTFSGSLPSLAQLLAEVIQNPASDSAVVYSGFVSSQAAVKSFLHHTLRLPSVRFASFQEADEVAIDRFINYLSRKDSEQLPCVTDTVAVLSEDETEYGKFSSVPHAAAASATSPPVSNAPRLHVVAAQPCASHVAPMPRGLPLQLYFPREISRLRAAYQAHGTRSTGQDSATEPQGTLPLNLEVSGDDGDTVPAFSQKQTPLSQDAVLLGIVSELRKHDIRYVIVRASDPLDTLFLTRYLTVAYPRGQIVTIGADLLFRREVQDKQLRGVLALSTYSLAPISNHLFMSYWQGNGERIFPSSSEPGVYNALRALRVSAGGPNTTRDRYCALREEPELYLYQYGWPDGFRNGARICFPSVLFNRPPVHLLALGGDDFWPVASLGPNLDGAAHSLLPAIDSPQLQQQTPTHMRDSMAPPQPAGQLGGAGAPHMQPQPQRLVPPTSWIVTVLIGAALAVGFAMVLWFSSISSASSLLAQFATGRLAAREFLIVGAALLHGLILLYLLWPLRHAEEAGWSIDHAAALRRILWAAMLAMMAASILEVACHFRVGWKAHKKVRVSSWAPIVLLVVGFTIELLIALAPDSESLADSLSGIRRFMVLRAVQITSGLSCEMPLLLLVGACLWWTYCMAGGYALLDERRPYLPSGNGSDSLRLLCEDPGYTRRRAWPPDGRQSIPRDHRYYTTNRLLDSLLPGPSSPAHYFLILAVGGGLYLVFNSSWPPLRGVEPAWFEKALLPALLALALFLLAGATFRLWGLWLETRRLLVSLDALPLRRGFEKLQGFSWTPIWRLGAGGMADFRKLVARELEAMGQAEATLRKIGGKRPNAPGNAVDATSLIAALHGRETILAQRMDILDQLAHTLAMNGRFGTRALERRELEWKVLGDAQAMLGHIARAAGQVLTCLAKVWHEQEEGQPRAASDLSKPDLAIRACERFVCLVYVVFLLAVLVRIRTLTMAIGGMYVFILFALTVYPFQPRGPIDALLLLVLLGVVGAVTGVFAQMHRDATLSKITNTKVGELGADFWMRTGSFVALPVASFVAAQFPQIGSMVSSWLEPALRALQK